MFSFCEEGQKWERIGGVLLEVRASLFLIFLQLKTDLFVYTATAT